MNTWPRAVALSVIHMAENHDGKVWWLWVLLVRLKEKNPKLKELALLFYSSLVLLKKSKQSRFSTF